MSEGSEPLHRPWVAAALAGSVAVVLTVAFVRVHRDDAPLPAIAHRALDVALPLWKTTEPVNEIVYGTRAFDTFGETFLLLAAVVTVTVLARGREPRHEYVGEAVAAKGEQARVDPAGSRGSARARTADRAEESDAQPLGRADRTRLGTPGPELSAEMTVVVRVAARAAAVVLAVAGVYLAAWGFSPGGGFPGGAALTGVAVLLYAALGYRAIRGVVRPRLLESLELAGAGAIIVVESLGLVLKGSFTANWVPLAPVGTIRSGGVLQLFSGAELVEVGTGLTIAIFALLGMRHEWSGGDDPR
jgi:multicomponent Na+:H+ antiporter subunit B